MAHPPVRAAGDDGLVGVDPDEGAEGSAERQYRPDPQGQAPSDHDDSRRGKGVRCGGVQRWYPTTQQDADPDRSREGEGDDHPRATVRTQGALTPDQIAYEQAPFPSEPAED
jgi:hypothetical protein